MSWLAAHKKGKEDQCKCLPWSHCCWKKSVRIPKVQSPSSTRYVMTNCIFTVCLKVKWKRGIDIMFQLGILLLRVYIYCLKYLENLLQVGHCRRHVDCFESPITPHWIPSFCWVSHSDHSISRRQKGLLAQGMLCGTGKKHCQLSKYLNHQLKPAKYYIQEQVFAPTQLPGDLWAMCSAP